MENEMNPSPTTIETSLSTLFASSQPRKEFVDDLAMQLHFQYLELKSSQIVIQPQRENWLHGIQRKLRARPVFLVLSILIAVMVLTGIVYAVGQLSGYIPGFGFTSSSQPVYVLSEPFKIEQDGILIDVEQAVNDEERFWVKISLQHLPEQPIYTNAFLLFEDGQRVKAELGQNGFSDGTATLAYSFPSLPAQINEITLMIENLLADPIHLQIRLRPIQDDELLPAFDVEGYPMMSESQFGLQLSLDYVAPTTDRTIFQVSLHFEDPGSMILGQWTVTLMDAQGHMYPLTEITPEIADRGKIIVFQTVPFQGNETLTLALIGVPQITNKINLFRDFSTNPGKFIFNPGQSPQVGTVWNLDERIQVGDFQLRAVKAELTNASELVFEFEPIGDVTGVMLYADTPAIKGSSGGFPAIGNNFRSAITFSALPRQPFEIQIRSVYYSVAGEWQINWTPPKAPDPSQVQALPTATIPVLPTPTDATPIQDALYLEVKRLSDQFDASFQQGPGWVHVITEQQAKVEEGQILPPPYLKSDEWYEIDADGNIQRSLYTEYSDSGTIMQQAATIGNYSINFTFGGGGYNEMDLRKFTIDRLYESFLHADEDKSEITGEEVDCLEGKRCLLIRVQNNFEHPMQFSGNEKALSATIFKVWIDLQTGLQFKFESIYLYDDGSEEVRTTKQVLLVEKVELAPEEVVGMLDRVVLP